LVFAWNFAVLKLPFPGGKPPQPPPSPPPPGPTVPVVSKLDPRRPAVYPAPKIRGFSRPLHPPKELFMKRFALIAAAALLMSLQALAQSDVGPKPGNGGGGAAGAGGGAVPRAPQPPLQIGVVDLSKIYDKWTKVKEFTDDLEVQKAAQETQLAAMEKEAKEKMTVRDTPGINIKIKQNAQIEIVQLKAKLEFMVQMWNDQVKRMLDEGIAKFFDEIRAEVDAYAKENGYTLVLKTESGPLSGEENKAASGEKIARIAVLACHPSLDITDDVLARLEEKYKKEKAAGPKKEEPPKDPK
jgi:Skp family chaperone for outer membrane proteins